MRSQRISDEETKKMGVHFGITNLILVILTINRFQFEILFLLLAKSE